ncbi:putative cysteine desulfurase, partial [Bienertia sinuspersici]
MLAGVSSAIKEWSTVTIWTDSARITQMLHNPENILNILNSFTACSVHKVSRACIKKAHDLAIQARKGL